MLTRREFMTSSSMIALGASVPSFLSKTAAQAPLASAAGARDTILVVVQLTGGNDGLNTVIPFKNEEYTKLRPTIGIKKDEAKKLTDDIGLHPAMEAIAKLHNASAQLGRCRSASRNDASAAVTSPVEASAMPRLLWASA